MLTLLMGVSGVRFQVSAPLLVTEKTDLIELLLQFIWIS